MTEASETDEGKWRKERGREWNWNAVERCYVYLNWKVSPRPQKNWAKLHPESAA